ncbi:Alpha-aminoadipic semialdehyde synthase, mitochondrial [Nymphon striatum]|nr:Alpha-aminoadipic semialdehyde synthase, mitochondrial [Nymphon striatum]
MIECLLRNAKSVHLCLKYSGWPKVFAISQRCSSTSPPKIIGIRREDASLWERRAALSPSNVKQLTRKGVKVLVQPSNRRAYPAEAYLKAGAQVVEDVSDATLIMGVKQIPEDDLLPNKTYSFFSHTIKAQESNMPMLDTIVDRNIRLIDYEKMCDSDGNRVVAFGNFAGVAGMINILHGLGLRLLALGHHTPFMHIGLSHNYRNSEMARQAIRDAGYEITLGFMPMSIGPLTFVFTGSGNVSQGAQEIFQELPYEYVEPSDLSNVAEHGSRRKVYCTVVSKEDHIKRKEDGGFDPIEFRDYPERYYSTFSKNIAPYASVIINGMYWAVNSPRLLTLPDAKYLLQPTPLPWLPSSKGCPSIPHRLLAICDISADPGGSIEFMKECTTIDNPFCLYDADQNTNTESFAGPGVLVCSIDNMPTQLPIEATDFFGNLLLPYVESMLNSDATKPLEDHTFDPVVQSAIIASNGRLTPDFEYISELRKVSRSRKKVAGILASQSKRILVIGSGYVSSPLVEYLTRDENNFITIASSVKKECDELATKYNNTEAVVIDIEQESNLLSQLVTKADVVVSLVPYWLHPKVVEHCIRAKTNMVTASYLTPEMREYEQAAIDAGITVVNEVGLDPGIDHLLAMECFEEVQQNGGKILSYVSYCGGLPAPECSSNPLRYKFSWSPRAVLLNTLGEAKYLCDSEVVNIERDGGLMKQAKELPFLPGFNFEGFPNRDSTVYKDYYGISDAHTVLRGTIRYKGFAEAVIGLQLMGLIDPNPHPSLHPRGPDISWKEFLCQLLGQPSDLLTPNVKNLIYERTGKSQFRADAIEDLGLLSDEIVEPMSTPLDTISHYLAHRLKYNSQERDLIVMKHNIGIEWPDKQKFETIFSQWGTLLNDECTDGAATQIRSASDNLTLCCASVTEFMGVFHANRMSRAYVQEQENRHITLVVYGDVDGFSGMAKTVSYPAAIATKMVLEGEIQQPGMVVPMTKDIYGPMLNRLKKEGIFAQEYSTYS